MEQAAPALPVTQKKITPLSVLGMIEKGFCVVSLTALVFIAVSEVLARFFHSSIPASSGFLTHFLLLLGKVEIGRAHV